MDNLFNVQEIMSSLNKEVETIKTQTIREEAMTVKNNLSKMDPKVKPATIKMNKDDALITWNGLTKSYKEWQTIKTVDELNIINKPPKEVKK